MHLHSAPGHFSLTHDTFHLGGGRPAAVLASADGLTEQRLEIHGEPTEQRTTVDTPVGRIAVSAWTWQLAGGHYLRWSVGTCADGTGCTVSVDFFNGGPQPVYLRELISFASDPDGCTVSDDPAHWLLTGFMHSTRVGTLAQKLPSVNDDERKMWHGFGLPVPYPLSPLPEANDGHWRALNDSALLVGPQNTIACAAVGSPEATVRFAFTVHGHKNSCQFSSEMSDVVVESGEWRQGQDIAILVGTHAPICERLMRWIAATHGARTHQPTAAGWCSWYHHGQAVAASDVIAIAEYAQHTGIPLPVIQIDDGFQCQVGDWACNDRFPHGWAPVIGAIHDAGSVPGVWLAPLAVHESTELFRHHPEWIQRDASGALVGEANNWGPRSRWLDPTHPQAAAWLRTLLSEHRDLGFRYFKIDFNSINAVSCVAPHATRLHNKRRTAFQALRDLYQLYREAIGEDSYLLACIGFTRAVAGWADASRIGPDSSSVWDAAHPCCFRACIEAVGQNAWANGILFANDPDVSYTRPRSLLTVAEWQTWHGFVGLLGGLALISEPLYMPDLLAGSAKVHWDGEFLHLEATVHDQHIARSDPPFHGSCVDWFVERDGRVAQIWLQPADSSGPARALRRENEKYLPIPEITVTSQQSSDGYVLTMRAPLSYWGFASTQRNIRWAAKAGAVLDRATAETRHTCTTGENQAPWDSVTDYRSIAHGETQSEPLRQKGWSGTEAEYERLNPPVPERGLSLNPSDPQHGRFGFTVQRPWGQWAVIQAWNPAATPADLSVSLTQFPDTPCHVWSYWDGAYLGVHKEKYTVQAVAAHGPALLRVTPDQPNKPVLVGSDLHIGCGAAEIDQVTCSAGRMSIALNDGGARQGGLCIAWPGTMQVVESQGCQAQIERGPDQCWKIALSARVRGQIHHIIVAYS